MNPVTGLVIFALLGGLVTAFRCVLFWRRRRVMPDMLEFVTAWAWGGMCGAICFAGLLIIMRAAGLALGT